MTIPYEPNPSDATADALIRLSVLVDEHGTGSPAVKDFIRKNEGLPEFKSLADETVRLERQFKRTWENSGQGSAAPAALKQGIPYAAVATSCLVLGVAISWAKPNVTPNESTEFAQIASLSQSLTQDAGARSENAKALKTLLGKLDATTAALAQVSNQGKSIDVQIASLSQSLGQRSTSDPGAYYSGSHEGSSSGGSYSGSRQGSYNGNSYSGSHEGSYSGTASGYHPNGAYGAAGEYHPTGAAYGAAGAYHPNAAYGAVGAVPGAGAYGAVGAVPGAGAYGAAAYGAAANNAAAAGYYNALPSDEGASQLMPFQLYLAPAGVPIGGIGYPVGVGGAAAFRRGAAGFEGDRGGAAAFRGGDDGFRGGFGGGFRGGVR